MAKRTIIWTKTADIQFVGVLEYWALKNKSNVYSLKLVELVAKKTKSILESPFIFKSADFKDVRVAPMENFSIYYKVTDEQIIISAFWDNRQNPKKLLKVLRAK